MIALLVPRLSLAQSNSTGVPDGVECHTDDKGVYTCTGLNNGQGYNCTTAANGDRVCSGSNNGDGYTCTTSSTGELTCTGSSKNSDGNGNGNGGGGGGSGGGFVTKITSWASGATTSVGNSIVALLKDLVVSLVAAILGLFALIVSAIPVPDFLKTYSLGALLSAAGPDVGWFLVTFKVAEGLTAIGAGYAFRLLRKLLTLFQW